MTDDLARIILLGGFAVVAPIGLYHRLRARTDEKLDRRQEGWLVLLTLRPLAVAFMAGLATFLIAPHKMAWAAVELPSGVRWTGVVIGIAASGLLIWTFYSLGRNLTDTVVARREATLVVHGPYRWVRHPFYLAFALAVIANALLTASAYLAITGGAAFVAIVARTSIEEQNLIDRFGDDYVDYMRRTGRFLPRPGGGTKLT